MLFSVPYSNFSSNTVSLKGEEDEQLQTHDRSEGKTKTERQRSYNEQPHQQSLRKNVQLWENV